VGYLFAYTRKYPIPPKKPAVIVVASKLETNLTNRLGNVLRESPKKNAARYTVSVLPEFVLPYLRFSLLTISLFLVARLLNGDTLKAAAQAASQPNMPYQRGQFWIRRFRAQTMALCFALVSRTTAVSAATFVTRALQMLQTIGWIPAHRFLFSELRFHLLGWPPFLVPNGIPVRLQSAEAKT
jgi:hypothetical protein